MVLWKKSEPVEEIFADGGRTFVKYTFQGMERYIEGKTRVKGMNFDIEPYCDRKTLAVDIGCTIGVGADWISRFLDRGFEHVVAFEPNPVGWDLTYDKYKDDRRITLYHMAIAPDAYFSITMKDCHGGKPSPGGWISTETNLKDERPSKRDYKVDAATLDSFNLQPQVIKIDVDGADLNVLRSCQTTLHTCKCVIIEHRFDKDEIKDFLTERGFTHKETSGQDSFFVRE